MKRISMQHWFKLTLTMAAATWTAIGMSQTALINGDDDLFGSAGDQSDVAISYSGSSFLVVWSDSRANPYGSYDYETGRDIYGIRLDQFGNPIATLKGDEDADVAKPISGSFAIYQGKASQTRPKAIWNGSMWLVVFDSVQNNGTGYYDTGLMAVRVSAEGKVLDDQPIRFFGLKQSGYGYAAASDGNNWVIVNQSTDASSHIVGMRVSPNGIVLDPPNRVLVPQTYYMRSNFHLAFAGGAYMLTFNGQNGTDICRFDTNLNVLSYVPEALNSSVAALASNGSQFAIFRSEQQLNFSNGVTATRFNSAGVKLDAQGILLSGANPITTGTPFAAWDGSQYRVFWQSGSQVRGAGLSISGSAINPGGVLMTGLNPGALSSNLNGGLVDASIVYQNFNNEVISQFITPTNAVGPMVTASLSAPRHTRPEVAKGSTGSMLVYRSETDAWVRILAQPLDSMGNQVGGPVVLAQANPVSGLSTPNIAFNGALYMVTWGDSVGVSAVRINQQAQVVGSPANTIMPAHFGPADVAAQGDTFLVIARRYGSSAQIIYAQAVRVRGTDGAVLDANPINFGALYVSRPPVVVAHNGGWLAAYISNWSHNNSGASSAVAFIPVSGVGVTSVGTHLFSTAGGNGVFEMALASNGTRALFVIPEELTSGVETDLRGQLIEGTTLLASFNLTPWRGNQFRPNVAWDGNYFVVTYQEQRNRLIADSLEQLDARSDLYGMRVSTNGAPLDSKGFVIAAGNTSETDPSVVKLNNSTLFMGSIMHNAARYSNMRIVTKRMGTAGNMWPVANLAADQDGGNLPLTVAFSSVGSFDPEGQPVSYHWSFGDGGTSTLANPTHTYTTAGPFRVYLVVRDLGGEETVQTMVVDAHASNVPPVAILDGLPSSGHTPLDVSPNAFRSYDPDGQLGNIEWVFDGQNVNYGAQGFHTFTSPGQHTVLLKVWDNTGALTTVSRTVTVSP